MTTLCFPIWSISISCSLPYHLNTGEFSYNYTKCYYRKGFWKNKTYKLFKTHVFQQKYIFRFINELFGWTIFHSVWDNTGKSYKNWKKFQLFPTFFFSTLTNRNPKKFFRCWKSKPHSGRKTGAMWVPSAVDATKFFVRYVYGKNSSWSFWRLNNANGNELEDFTKLIGFSRKTNLAFFYFFSSVCSIFPKFSK